MSSYETTSSAQLNSVLTAPNLTKTVEDNPLNESTASELSKKVISNKSPYEMAAGAQLNSIITDSQVIETYPDYIDPSDKDTPLQGVIFFLASCGRKNLRLNFL